MEMFCKKLLYKDIKFDLFEAKDEEGKAWPGGCCEDPAPIMKSGAPDCLGKRGLVAKLKAPRTGAGPRLLRRA